MGAPPGLWLLYVTRWLHRAAHISPPINTFDSLQDNNRLSAAASRSNTLLECAPGGAGSTAGGGGEQQAGGGGIERVWQVGGGGGDGKRQDKLWWGGKKRRQFYCFQLSHLLPVRRHGEKHNNGLSPYPRLDNSNVDQGFTKCP